MRCRYSYAGVKSCVSIQDRYRGHVRAGLRHVGQERVGQEDDLLLGLAGVHRVDREQFRCQLARFRLARLADRRCGGPRAPTTGSRAGARPRRPPSRTRSESGGSAASSRCSSVVPLRIMPTTTIGATIGLLEDLGIPPDPFLGAQPHPQAVHEARAQDVRADLVEARRRRRSLSGSTASGVFERQRAPVLQAFLLLRGGMSSPRRRRRRACAVRSALQVVADVADLVDEHDPGVEPPRPSTRWKVSR